LATGFQVTFDAGNPDKLADFWAEALGYIKQPPPTGYSSWEDWLRAMNIPEDKWDSASAAVDPEGKGPRLYFQKVPEGKTAKNRVHLDINASAGKATAQEERTAIARAEAERLVAAGATRLREVDEGLGFCVVMQDPEGNEFCVQ
jgi:hypothetical protein